VWRGAAAAANPTAPAAAWPTPACPACSGRVAAPSPRPAPRPAPRTASPPPSLCRQMLRMLVILPPSLAPLWCSPCAASSPVRRRKRERERVCVQECVGDIETDMDPRQQGRGPEREEGEVAGRSRSIWLLGLLSRQLLRVGGKVAVAPPGAVLLPSGQIGGVPCRAGRPTESETGSSAGTGHACGTLQVS
jgi:hypothetical protein